MAAIPHHTTQNHGTDHQCRRGAARPEVSTGSIGGTQYECGGTHGDVQYVIVHVAWETQRHKHSSVGSVDFQHVYDVEQAGMRFWRHGLKDRCERDLSWCLIVS